MAWGECSARYALDVVRLYSAMVLDDRMPPAIRVCFNSSRSSAAVIACPTDSWFSTWAVPCAPSFFSRGVLPAPAAASCLRTFGGGVMAAAAADATDVWDVWGTRFLLP